MHALAHRVAYFKIKNDKVVNYWSGVMLNNKGVVYNNKALSSLPLLKKELVAKNIGDPKYFSKF